jgi:DNA-binding transcriptional LysR family regulator
MGPGNRPLDMEWLEDFQALAKTGNFSRAAEARAIAQPAFSRHIRSLEEWVGVDLVDRSAHPADLTAAGKRFLPLMEEVLAGLEAARIKARIAHDQHSASLRFAATHVLSIAFFPGWLGGMEARLRLGPVQTVSDSFQACEDQMLQRKVQFVMCYGHPDVPSRLDEGAYPMALLGEDTLVPVAAPGEGGRPAYDLDMGGIQPVLGYSEVSGLGRILKRVWPRLVGDEGPGPLAGSSVVFTAHNAILLQTMAVQGRGIAWLPRSVVANDLQAQRLVVCGGGRWQVPIQVRLYRQRTEMAAVAEAVWQSVTAS